MKTKPFGQIWSPTRRMKIINRKWLKSRNPKNKREMTFKIAEAKSQGRIKTTKEGKIEGEIEEIEEDIKSNIGMTTSTKV